MNVPRHMTIWSAINGTFNNGVQIFPPNVPAIGTWTQMTIIQELVGSNYLFEVYMNGTNVASATNIEPTEFHNVTIKTDGMPASVRKLVIQTKNGGGT